MLSIRFQCRTSPHFYGPFSQIDSVNGPIWVVPAHAEINCANQNHKQLLAKYLELSDRWSDFEANKWSSIRI